MILLIDLCGKEDALSHDEFVGPVARIVERTGKEWRSVHFSRAKNTDLTGIFALILCGTALQDNVFREHVQDIAPLVSSGLPVLGICAGMQALCLLAGGALRPACEIGMVRVRRETDDPLLCDQQSFEAYEVHASACTPPPGWIVTAVSDTCVQAMRHPARPLFGVMFHPEVRNDQVVERFCAFGRQGI